MKRVFLIHGWGGYPEDGWWPWLAKELVAKGFVAANPLMPNTNFPQVHEWVSYLSEIVGSPDKDCYFIGHSLGVITILRYLETLKNVKIGGAIFVAGFTDDLGIPELSNFFQIPIQWETIRKSCDKFISVQSDNDPYNLLPYNEAFKEKLSAQTLVAHNMKHFSGDDGIVSLPIVLKCLLTLTNHA